MAEEPSSYISDDDLLFLSDHDDHHHHHHHHSHHYDDLPVTNKSRELSTEEQIEVLRQQAERSMHLGHDDRKPEWAQAHVKKARMVRFAGEDAAISHGSKSSKGRRSSSGSKKRPARKA